MRVVAVRYLNNGLELVRFRNVVRGFEVFALCVKGESLARTVGSNRFNFYGRVRWQGTRLLALVMKKEPEARQHIGFEDSDFNIAVTEVHEEAIVRPAFDFPTVMRVSAQKMSMAMAFAAKMFNHMVEAESHQRSARDPRKPTASLGAQLDKPSDQKAVTDDQHHKTASRQYYPFCFLHGD